MTIQHHPGQDLLFDYAAGSLGEAWSLAIATHLALCPACRRLVAAMETVGGGLLETVAPEDVSENAFDGVLARISHHTSRPDAPPSVTLQSGNAEPSQAAAILPQPLRRYAGGDVVGLDWQRLGLGASQLLIPTSEPGATARLLLIPAGRPVPTHSHGGLELTLVLSGAFEDKTGHYGRGDLQEADGNLEHQPHATPHADCICLAVTDAPLKFKSLAARMVQPFLGI